MEQSYETRAARLRAIAIRDRAADGAFVYAVKTTGIYCRPSCGARRAKTENIECYDSAHEAEKAGFRPCKRCRPAAHVTELPESAAVTSACGVIERSEEPPDLETLSAAVGLSSSHLHRSFRKLTGVTPKEYADAVRADRVREGLTSGKTVTTAMYAAGFNSSGRFYAESARLLGMTPSAYRRGGKGELIRFALGECSLGSILVAASAAGICAIALGDDPGVLLEELQRKFASAELVGGDGEFETLVARVVGFVENPALGLGLPLEVRGTAFQHRVWKKLCEIPCGSTWSYTQLAEALGIPRSARAVASACAANSIAVAIPCHRVVRSDNALSGYRWGLERKAELLRRERKG